MEYAPQEIIYTFSANVYQLPITSSRIYFGYYFPAYCLCPYNIFSLHVPIHQNAIGRIIKIIAIKSRRLCNYMDTYRVIPHKHYSIYFQLQLILAHSFSINHIKTTPRAHRYCGKVLRQSSLLKEQWK